MNKIGSVLKAQITSIVGEKNVSIREVDLEAHSHDRSFHKAVLPDIVVWPRNTDDVSALLKIAHKNKIPVTAWGGGTSLEGHPIPVRGGIILDMTKLDKVISVYKEDLQVRVQPGIIGEELNKQLLKSKLFFPAFPGSAHIATVGGMIANNAGGMYAVKYGVVGDWILSLEVVLANGDIINTGTRSFKSVSGYDLTKLFIASEGTLGIITEAVLKLAPIPENKIALMVSFETTKQAAQTAISLRQSDVEASAIEFMDSSYIKLVNQAMKSKLPEKETLIVELHGNQAINKIKLSLIKKLCKQQRSLKITKFVTNEENKLLWQYRRAVRPVLSKILPTMGVLSAEVGVPLGEMEGFLKKAKHVSQKYQLQTIMFGHMGDGNFHGWALYELHNDKAWQTVSTLNEELVTYAIQVGGTTTGEHGLGIGKSKYLPLEHPTTLPIMKNIKQMFDPHNILNPGKMFLD